MSFSGIAVKLTDSWAEQLPLMNSFGSSCGRFMALAGAQVVDGSGEKPQEQPAG